MSSPARYCGRDFSTDEIELIGALASRHATRTAVAAALCDELGWRRPDGRLKEMSARVALLRMQADGLVRLPAPRNSNGNGRIEKRREALPQAELSPPGSPRLVELVLLTDKAQRALWREMIAQHHYLGFNNFAGAQLRYLITSGTNSIGALGFSASAWRLKARDTHIGWDDAQRAARLHLVVGNARFLIMPGASVANLASHVLSRAARRLPRDWQRAYGYSPVLLESFVEAGRFAGTSYRAANWLFVGTTAGRGKLDRYNDHALAVKDIYLYPLRRDYREVLTASL